MIVVGLESCQLLPPWVPPRAVYSTHPMLNCFDVLAHLTKNCFMVFMSSRLLRRNDCMPRRMTHTGAVLLFDPDVMSELRRRVIYTRGRTLRGQLCAHLETQGNVLKFGCELRYAL
jgi:hypothetical protein